MITDDDHKGRFFITVGWIIVLGYALRLFHTVYYYTLSRDSYTYVNIIEQDGAVLDLDVQESIFPLFVWIYRIPHYLLPDSLNAYRGLSLAFGLTTIYVIICITRQIIDNRIAWISSGLLAATEPRLVHYSSQIQRESLYLLFCSLILLFAIKYMIRQNWRNLTLLSCVWGCSPLIRHESVEFIPFIILGIYIANINKPLSRRFLCIFLWFGVSIVVAFSVLSLIDPTNVFIRFYSNRIYGVLVSIK